MFVAYLRSILGLKTVCTDPLCRSTRARARDVGLCYENHGSCQEGWFFSNSIAILHCDGVVKHRGGALATAPCACRAVLVQWHHQHRAFGNEFQFRDRVNVRACNFLPVASSLVFNARIKKILKLDPSCSPSLCISPPSPQVRLAFERGCQKNLGGIPENEIKSRAPWDGGERGEGRTLKLGNGGTAVCDRRRTW